MFVNSDIIFYHILQIHKSERFCSKCLDLFAYFSFFLGYFIFLLFYVIIYDFIHSHLPWKGYASQGTPPSSPAATSVFSRVMGAATGNKQAPGSGNPLGIAAVLLQGAQGKMILKSLENSRKRIEGLRQLVFLIFHFFFFSLFFFYVIFLLQPISSMTVKFFANFILKMKFSVTNDSIFLKFLI